MEMERGHRGEPAIGAADGYRLFAFNPHPMWVFDLDTLQLLDVNQAAVRHYGYSRQEFLRMTIRDLRPVDDLPRLVRHLPRTRENPVPPTTRWRHVKKDGSLIDVEIASVKVGFGGRPAKIVTVIDVTARRGVAEAARLMASVLVKLRELGQESSISAAREMANALSARVSEALDEFKRYIEVAPRGAGDGESKAFKKVKGLSAREREVLERIVQGHTNREVAEELGLSIKSVEAYRARLMSKLALRNRVELVRYGLERGLLRPGK
jgi:PAS domain S-box-containing protein